MLLTLFAVLLGVALACVWLGATTDIPIFILAGITLVFILAVFVVLPGTLEYQTGELKNYTYVGNETRPASETTTYTVTAFSDSTSHRFGWLLSGVSALAFAIYLTHLNGGFKRGDS